MSSTEFYTLHHSGCFRFPEEHRLILQRMFVTAAGNLDQKEIRVRIAGHKKYYEAKRECRLKGIRLEAVKISPFEYEYLATIRPKISNYLYQASNIPVTTLILKPKSQANLTSIIPLPPP